MVPPIVRMILNRTLEQPISSENEFLILREPDCSESIGVINMRIESRHDIDEFSEMSGGCGIDGRVASNDLNSLEPVIVG